MLATVATGGWSYERARVTTLRTSASGRTWSSGWSSWRASGSSVTGTAVRYTASGTASCEWFMGWFSAAANATWADTVRTSSGGSPVRVGFATSGACGGLDSAVLPEELDFEPVGAWAPAAWGTIEWYEPALGFRVTDSTTSSGSDSAGAWSREIASTWAGGDLTGASPFVTVLP